MKRAVMEERLAFWSESRPLRVYPIEASRVRRESVLLERAVVVEYLGPESELSPARVYWKGVS